VVGVAVPVSEQRKLLQRSGGVCAFPRCRRALTTDAETTGKTKSLGQIAHIVGESVHGPRGDHPLSLPERNRCENLILLCGYHHALIDAQPELWTVPWLHAMKQAHEYWVQQQLGAVDPVSGEGVSARSDFVEWFLRTGDNLPRADAEIDRALLGIHAALPLPPGPSTGLSPQLPTYVPRDLDEELRGLLAERSVHGGFVLLAGPSASGKSRCAYEAVRAVLPDWRMLLPPSAKDLTSLVNAGIPLGRTVIWLDDVPRFLGQGMLTARTVRRLLTDGGDPAILIGTTWPAEYERLMAATGEGTVPDTTTEAQQILLLAHRFDVAGQFTATECARAVGIAQTDPRIGEALGHTAAGGIPSVLACAPELIHRWVQPADNVGGAIITAAVEARLCGHPALIPPGLLKRLTEVYLTPAQRATAPPSWFEAAIAWACHPVRASIAPLAPSARRIGELDGYEVSDILVDHGMRRYAARQKVPVAPWEVLADHSTLDACEMIGMRAIYSYGLSSAGARALRRVAEAGRTEAMVSLAMTYLEEDDLDNASLWYLAAAEAGDAAATAMLAVVLQRQGDGAGAREWFRRGAEAGDTAAMIGYGGELEKDGDLTAARKWYEKSAEAGDEGQGMLFLGCMLREQGDLRAALDCFLRAAESARSSMDDLLSAPEPVPASAGGRTAARKFRESITKPYRDTALCLGETYLATGDTVEARAWLEQAAGLGHPRAMIVLGSLLFEARELDQAQAWLRPAAEAGEPEAMFYLGMILDLQGHVPESGTWLERAARSGAAPAMGRYAIFLAERGDHEGAREWGAKARDAGDPLIETLLAAWEKLDPSASEAATDAFDEGSTPGQIAWTPLAHACGCVTDWGWDAAHADPLAFINWFAAIIDTPCLWHASDPAPPDDLVMAGHPDGKSAFYARKATGDDIALGRKLTRELTRIRQLTASGDTDAISGEIPPAYRNWMNSNGYDPVDTWLQQRLTDLILNRGRSLLLDVDSPAT
jgi:TPR repeat protein